MAGGERTEGNVKGEEVRKVERGQIVSRPGGQNREFEFYPTGQGKSFEDLSMEVK